MRLCCARWVVSIGDDLVGALWTYSKMMRKTADLNKREMEDLHAGRHSTVTQYRQRVAQLLTTYTAPTEGQEYSFSQRLVRGMPRRLAKCRANRFGPCGI